MMQIELIEKNPILKLTLDFSLEALKYCGILESQRRYAVANQLLRAATSIGANVMEAQNAESKADFIHKIKIAAKEADETQYWLLLCHYSNGFPDCTSLSAKLDQIQRMLNRIIRTAKSKSSDRP
jgi:four helix bundle protein